MELNLKLASETDANEWDEFVNSTPHSTIFHTWDWLRTIEKHSTIKKYCFSSTGKLHPLMEYNGDELVGVLPIFSYSFPGFNIALSPPTRVEVPYLGPLLKDYDSLKQDRRETIYNSMIWGVEKYMSTNIRPAFIYISSSPSLFDARPFQWRGYRVEPRYTYEIPLSKDIEQIKNHINANCRKKISKAEKASVEVILGGEDSVENIFEMLQRRRMSQGEEHRVSQDCIKDLYKRYGHTNITSFIANYGGKPVGGLLAINYNGKTQVWFGNPKSSLDGVNELLIWKVIEWSVQKNMARLEIIDANMMELSEFKSKFNPQLLPYFIATKYKSKLFNVINRVGK